jgi:phosphoribosyl 1,2-cyclic phosphate phosphodiesterase
LNGETFSLGGVLVTPFDILHGNLKILGYKLNNCAYITDCSGIPDASRGKLKNLDILIINAVGFDPHPTHFSLGQALEAIEDLQPKRAILTHINHTYDHKKVSEQLPENIELAYDGMSVNA